MTRIEEFLKHTTACGGNWTAMILTGIESMFPDYYESMEDKRYSFVEAIDIVYELLYPTVVELATVLNMDRHDLDDRMLEYLEEHWRAFYKEPTRYSNVADMVLEDLKQLK